MTRSRWNPRNILPILLLVLFYTLSGSKLATLASERLAEHAWLGAAARGIQWIAEAPARIGLNSPGSFGLLQSMAAGSIDLPEGPDLVLKAEIALHEELAEVGSAETKAQDCFRFLAGKAKSVRLMRIHSAPTLDTLDQLILSPELAPRVPSS